MCPSAYKFFRSCQEIEVWNNTATPLGFFFGLNPDPERVAINIAIGGSSEVTIVRSVGGTFVRLARVVNNSVFGTAFFDHTKLGSYIQGELSFGLEVAATAVLISVLRSPKDFK